MDKLEIDFHQDHHIYKTASLYDLIMLSMVNQPNNPEQKQNDELDLDESFIQRAITQQQSGPRSVFNSATPNLRPSPLVTTPSDADSQNHRISRA